MGGKAEFKREDEMIGRRGLLSLLGLGGAAAAVSIPAHVEAKAALPMWVEQDGHTFNVRVKCHDGKVRTLWRWVAEEGAPDDFVALSIYFNKPMSPFVPFGMASG
jgi:hypothetical protein